MSEQTGTPIPDVIVSAAPPGVNTRTDTTGVFRLVGLGSEEFELEFRRLGFSPLVLTVVLEDSVQVGDLGLVKLRPIATELEAIVVEAERDRRLADVGFYDRRKLGFGSFVDRDAIEEMNPGRLTDIIKRMRGFRVSPNHNYMKSLPPKRSVFGLIIEPSAGIDIRSYIISSKRGSDCAPLVFVDGVSMGTTLDTDVDRYLHPLAVQGIELYTGAADLPVQLNKSGAECGVLVIWTR